MIRPRASPTSGWREHLADGRAAQQVRPAQVDRHHRVPVVRLGLEQRLRVRTREHRVVDDDVERAGALDRRRDEPLARRPDRTRPHRCTPRCRRRATITSSVGSPPVIGSRRMSATSTSKPSAARRIAIALPIPDAAPVTIALRRSFSATSRFVYSPDDRRRLRRALPAQPERQDRRRGALSGHLLAARRRAPRTRLAHRADAVPGAHVHRAEPLLGGQGAARHGRLPPPLPRHRRCGLRRDRGARAPRRRGDHGRHRGKPVDGRAHHELGSRARRPSDVARGQRRARARAGDPARGAVGRAGRARPAPIRAMGISHQLPDHDPSADRAALAALVEP